MEAAKAEKNKFYFQLMEKRSRLATEGKAQ